MESNLNVENTSEKKFSRFAWFVVGYNLLVIIWGAFVRASKSGDGCGASYPLCNGMIIPHAAEIKTIVEFSHRLSSGLALLMVIALVIWAFRAFPKKHRVRYGAVFSLIFIITEALIGAGLVLFGLVAQNDSMARAFSMAAHLINTFILVAFLSLTAWWASGGKSVIFKGNAKRALFSGLALLGMLFVGVSGAIAALGDTLFPVSSLAEGFRQDLSPTAHALIRLRIWHPILSVSIGLFTALLALWFVRQKQNSKVTFWGKAVIGLVLIQLACGALNVLLLTPIWMQMVHLLLADLMWISMILLFASTLSETSEAAVQAKQANPVLETVTGF